MPDRPVVCCDLDGVVWRGDEPIEGGAAAIAMLRDAGVRVVFVTNNSGNTAADYVAKLAGMAIPTTAADVLSSAMAAARWCRASLAPGARVLACAGAGVREALGAQGFVVVDEAPAAAVVVGFHREFDYERLTRAADAARAGARLVATNTDPTYPGPNGTLLPGAGSIAAAVAIASGCALVVVGKPHETLAALVKEVCGERGVMIGDRATTDGAFAAALGWPFAFVRSGVPGDDDAPVPPALVADDLLALAPRLLESGLVAATP
jgi:HAD superfamily hydrolase (TIGR01450 family)